MDEKNNKKDDIDINIDEYISKEWGEETSKDDKGEKSNDKNEPKLNDALSKKSSQKKYTAKTEKQLQKDKAKYFTKIAIFTFVILLILFLITLVIKTIIKQESLENRKSFKEQEKIVEINENPSDYWKKKMQLRFNTIKTEQDSFKIDIKQSMLDFENNSEERFNKFQEALTDNLNSIRKDVSNQMSSVSSSIEKIEKINSDKFSKQNNTIDELKNEVKKVKEEEKETIDIQLPPMKYLTRKNEKNEKELPKIEVVYEDINIIAEDESKDNNKKTETKTENGESGKNGITLFSGFIKVISLTSIKGPTGTKASSELYPVRLQTIGELVGANNKRIDLDSCYIKSIAKGDITTLRNLLTVNTLYCNGKDDKGDYLIQAQVKGQIYDELDGGLGFPGVLVDSAGKLLSRELSLAIVQGGAQMLDKTENVVFPDIGSLSASKTSFGQEFTSGAGAGFSKGLDGIVKYWRDTLKGYYPFIDSKAARVGQAFIEITSTLEKKYYDSSFSLNKENNDSSKWESIIK